MPRRTDIQSGRAETPLSDAPPSTEGGAAGDLAEESWRILDEAMEDFEAFAADIKSTAPTAAIERLMLHRQWALDHTEIALSQGTPRNLKDEIFYTAAAVSANLWNYHYRALQRDPSNRHQGPSLDWLKDLLHLPMVDVPSKQYWTGITRTRALVKAYREGWTPDQTHKIGPYDGRMMIAMVAVAERLGLKAEGGDYGAKTVEKYRNLVRKHLKEHPVIFNSELDAFQLNPALFWLSLLPHSRGRPPKNEKGR